MSIIQINKLEFAYPGTAEPIFNNVSLNLDTGWRLGLIGRNGRGKTTFLRLLLGELEGSGGIVSSHRFEYFPVKVDDPAKPALAVARAIIAPFDEWEREIQRLLEQNTPAALEQYGEMEHQYAAADGYTINETFVAEAGRLGVDEAALERPFSTLSGGEQVKLMLAALFLKKHAFLLIDEPTDHLDAEGRASVARWLKTKSGFILVSHDRFFLDEAIDHVLSINRSGIELQKGNYSSWRQNRTMQDEFEKTENEKLKKSIGRLRASAAQAGRWSDKVEKSKIGASLQDDAPAMVDKGFIGTKAAKMMQRSKSLERRKEKEIEKKEVLLKNIEEVEPVKFQLLTPAKNVLASAEGLGFGYGGALVLDKLDFVLQQGQRVAVTGANGCGKTSLLKLVKGEYIQTCGSLYTMAGLVISSLPQQTEFLRGGLKEFAARQKIDYSLFLTILRKLNFERETFVQPMEKFSSGQKKKVCIAASLARPAHLFVWDEPLNYIDVLSREQIEQAVLKCCPTILFVEHDATFTKAVATDYIAL